MKFSEAIEGARLRVGTILRERKEKAAERRAAKAMHPTRHFHGDEFLISFLLVIVITAGIVEWLWAVLFTINTTGLLVLNSEWSLGNPIAWVAAFDARWPVLLGRASAMAVIVGWSMIWLPVWFKARGGGRWLRVTMAIFGLLCNGLVVLQGTFVLNETRQDQIRSELVVEQSAVQGRNALQTQLDLAREELRAITNPDLTSYQAQAARDGTTAWARRVEIARRQNDYQFPAIERAIVSAERADQLRADVARLTLDVRNATPEAATAASVEDSEGVAINTIGRMSEVYWPLIAALGTTGIGIFGAWWLVYVWGRTHHVETSGWAREDQRIEDKRAEEPIASNPVKVQTQVRATNAETGEEEVLVKPRPYWRRARRGTPTRVEVNPDIPPDETGVPHDGGGRSGSVAINDVGLPASGVAADAPANAGDAEESRIDEEQREPVVQDEPLFQLSDEEAATSFGDELAPADATDQFVESTAEASEPASDDADNHIVADAPVDESVTNENRNGEQEQDHHELQDQDEPEQREPETREDRLLPAAVAAE